MNLTDHGDPGDPWVKARESPVSSTRYATSRWSMRPIAGQDLVDIGNDPRTDRGRSLYCALSRTRLFLTNRVDRPRKGSPNEPWFSAFLLEACSCVGCRSLALRHPCVVGGPVRAATRLGPTTLVDRRPGCWSRRRNPGQAWSARPCNGMRSKQLDIHRTAPSEPGPTSSISPTDYGCVENIQPHESPIKVVRRDAQATSDPQTAGRTRRTLMDDQFRGARTRRDRGEVVNPPRDPCARRRSGIPNRARRRDAELLSDRGRELSSELNRRSAISPPSASRMPMPSRGSHQRLQPPGPC